MIRFDIPSTPTADRDVAERWRLLKGRYERIFGALFSDIPAFVNGGLHNATQLTFIQSAYKHSRQHSDTAEQRKDLELLYFVCLCRLTTMRHNRQAAAKAGNQHEVGYYEQQIYESVIYVERCEKKLDTSWREPKTDIYPAANIPFHLNLPRHDLPRHDFTFWCWHNLPRHPFHAVTEPARR